MEPAVRYDNESRSVSSLRELVDKDKVMPEPQWVVICTYESAITGDNTFTRVYGPFPTREAAQEWSCGADKGDWRTISFTPITQPI